MAEFELQMKYSTPPMLVGVHFLAVLFPIWGILVPTLAILFITLLLRLPANVPLYYSLPLIAVLICIILLCTVCALICDDSSIQVSKEGLSFPLRFWPALKFKNHQTWKELGALTLNWKRDKTFGPNENISFIFRGGGAVTLKLRHLDLKELEQFFIAFESCAPNCERDAELTDLEHSIQTKQLGSELSFTQLWDKSLAQRFSGTVFRPLEPGKQLQEGGYKIFKQLSFGGNRAAYLARSEVGDFVVLKELWLPENKAQKDEVIEAFKNKVTLLSKLSHKNIVKMLDYFLEDGRHYLVLEHINGNSLSHLVTQKGMFLSDATVIDIAYQILSALSYLQQLSPPVMHGAIAPDNLLIKPDGTVMLIDFGTTQEVASSLTGTVSRQQAYIAPEQYRGKPSPQSDIYGLGATLFFLLTGKQPEPLTTCNFLPERTSIETDLSTLLSSCTAQEESARPTCLQIMKSLDESRVRLANEQELTTSASNE